jgi:hypothetical protein
MRWDCLAPLAAEQADLRCMFIRMARLTVCGTALYFVRIQCVVNFQVTIEAVHFVVGDMRLVQKLMVVDPSEIIGAIVAHSAALERHLALTPD